MKLLKFSKSFQRVVMAVLIPSFATVSGPVRANPAAPSGLDIDAGNVVVTGLGTATVDINNFNQHAIVNWDSFSIQQGEVARFNQGANAAILNRVITNNPTEIYGRLEASQGSVFLLNPNGVLVGAGGVVDVAGMMTMSTLDVDDADFRNGGDMQFSGSSNTGITNFGTISSAGGDVVLMGGFVDNKSGGQIGALNGTVAIGSGGDIILHEGGGTRISVRGASDYEGTGVDNQGEVRGASVEMKAHGNVYALAINNGGAVRATGADRSNGRVRLMASGGSSNINLGQGSNIVARAGVEGGSVEVKSVGGSVAVDGKIDAVGATEGGDIVIAGAAVTQAAGSVVSVSGGQAAGSVAVDAVDSVTLAGAIQAKGITGSGGEVTVTANRILINDSADLSADGSTTGGRIRVGGDFQGMDTGLREADSLRVEAGARLSADSLGGDAGTVIAWANQDTIFVGEISASARGAVGNGGTVEVSGKKFLYFDGVAEAHSIGGKAGTVLFDPGDVIVGAAGTVPVSPGFPTAGSPPPLPAVQSSTVSITSVNNALQSGSNVLIITDDGNIFINPVVGGGAQNGATGANDRHSSIQWTNSNASFGAFASGVIAVGTHIRTSGAGSINLLGGWSGSEGDFAGGVHTATGLNLSDVGSVQGIWDHYVAAGAYGDVGGSVFIGSTSSAQHVEVGSRFGDTNVAGYEIRVTGSDVNAEGRYAQIGFRDSGQVFAPLLNRGDGAALDLSMGAGVTGAWYLSDGLNSGPPVNQPANGVGNPIVAVAGMFEVDINNDGIVDGVRGINSTGVLGSTVSGTAADGDTFIPYANHYNSSSSGNWWWQRIDAASADPLGLGSLRPEYGAGIGEHSATALAVVGAGNFDGADINVIARANILIESGAEGQGTGAMIGHGGYNYFSYASASGRDTGTTVVNNTIERRWSFNGAEHDRMGTAIGRLAPVYGNINVLAGVTAAGAVVDHAQGTVAATLSNGGNVTLQSEQIFAGGSAPNSMSQIGHGGVGQFGEFYGDINVRAGGNINILAGEGTRSGASIGHTVDGYAYWNPSSEADQQLRFFATVADFDNPNLRIGELFSGAVSTGFDPNWGGSNTGGDPLWNRRISLATFTQTGSGTVTITVDASNRGNYIPRLSGVVKTGSLATGFTFTGTLVAGEWMNIHDLTLINTNPLAYTNALGDASGTGIANNTTTATAALNGLGPLNLSPISTALAPVYVDALDGSVINGFHGNIDVEAKIGSIRVTGYMTQGINGANARDRRFAQIGHGGTSFSAGSLVGASRTSSGYFNQLGTATAGSAANPDGRAWYRYRSDGINGDQSGSQVDYGAGGSISERRATFMSITGDIDVSAGQNITITAGNDIYDFAHIGHGGAELADYETSSFILGDIRVDAGGSISVIGGGGVQPINRNSTNLADGNNNYDLRAWAHIGHGGYQTGFLGFLGDISVNAGANILVQNGAFAHSFAKIGHQGYLDYGQSGGSFQRAEMFRAERVETDINTNLNATTASVTYSANSNSTTAPALLDLSNAVVGTRDFTASGAGTLVGSDRNTADISVTAGGSVTLNHMAMGERQPEARLAWLAAANAGQTVASLRADARYNADSQTLGVRTANSFSMIGHGGINTDELHISSNIATNFGDKIGNISVIANGGDVSLANGEGVQRWTRIGHGVGINDGSSDSANVGFSRAIELAGDIHVEASGDIILDASAAADDESAKAGNRNSNFGANPSRLNPVAIGHGGVDNNTDVVVLGQGEIVNGIAASSDITAIAGGDMSLIAGNGVDASSAQLGHGQRSDNGNDFARRFGVPTGFSGDIDVRVTGDLLIQGGSNAWTAVPDGLTENIGQSVHGAFAAIGHGGYMMDAPSSGDISVYVGGDANIIAQVRTDERTTTTITANYFIKNLQVGSDTVASAFNFAKIGHFSVENGDRTSTSGVANFNDAVNDARLTGDITVVVAGDLSLKGGTINVAPDAFEEDDDALGNADTHTIYGAFAQIGHGGPAIGGDLLGNITVLVNGNISVAEGANNGVPGVDSILYDPDGAGPLAPIPSRPMNNYAMIGNGDFLEGIRTVPTASDLFRRHSQGIRFGDIVVAAGNNASFDGALIGHADPLYAGSIPFSFGNTFVAASRLSPFYDPVGTGELTAINGTVFSSGGYGIGGGKMSFFVPSRSRNIMDGDTRINEASVGFTEAPADFADVPDSQGGAFDPTAEKLAGRNDEVYLTPDLWWDNLAAAAAAGFPGGAGFPTTASAGAQGGSIAIVDAPGGLPNLVTLMSGALGTSATVYRDNNGVSGAGYYTLYYDAIENVTTTFPYVPPVIPPYTGGDLGDYDSLDRQDGIFGDGYGGGDDSLDGNLGIFEADESNQEGSGVSRFENAIDNAFGPRQDSTSEEEEDEEERRRKRRAAEKVGPIGLTFYVYDPATNRLSSYRVFGTPSATLAPAN